MNKDLIELLDVPVMETPLKGMSEAAVSQRVELDACKRGARLWRNNVGACEDSRGNFIRYGLMNKSKQQNKMIKSSDLIGITPITITEDMVGQTVGVFTAVEVKKGSWNYSGNEHELAQSRFLELVKALGGIAKFENGSGL